MTQEYQHMRAIKRKSKNPDAFIDPYVASITFIQGNRGCIEENEFIYTQNGIGLVKDVYDGMPILGGYISKPYFFNDEVYEVEINKTRFIANGEHPIWITKDFPFRHNPKNERWITVKEIYDHYSVRQDKQNKWYAQKYNSNQLKINEISVGRTFAKLLGYLMSDGYFSETQSIKFTNVNNDLINEVVKLSMELSEEFQISLKSYPKGNGQDVMLTGVHGKNQSIMKDRLRELGVIERTTFGKLQTLKDDELIEFIKGYFNGDGNLYPSKRPVITFYTGIHKRIAYELEFMLWRLGINCLIAFRKSKLGFKGCWEVEVSESKSVRKLISILDTKKYPEKFIKAMKNLEQIKNTSDHFQTDKHEWVPITKIKKIGVKTVCGWQTVPSQEIVSYGGLRTHNSGKSSVDELIAEEHYKMGHTVVDLHSAGNYESLYWAVCHDCKKFWDKVREQQEKIPDPMNRQPEPLHCSCENRYKIIVVVPDYVQFDEDAIDNFNGRFYTKEEWANMGNFEYGRVVTKPNGEKVREKPIRADYIQWMKVRKLSIPNKGYNNRDQFVNELTEIMLLAQKERRIVVFNPIFYKDIPHKLVVLEKVLRELPQIIHSNFKALTTRTVAELRGVEEPVPFNQWTPQEENRHRVTILMREFGSLVSSQLTEERNQVIVKKAVFALVKILRHFHISLVGDFQRANDIYSGVRDQRDYFIWRCSNIDIVSDEYDWLRKDIKARRDQIIEKGLPAQAWAMFPNIEDLKPNQMYVLYPQKNERGNRYKLFNVGMPTFHHHQADDDFEVETGLVKETPNKKGTWRIVTKTEKGELVDSEKDRVNEDNKIREANMTKIFDVSNTMMYPTDPTKKKMKAPEMFAHIGDLGMIPDGWSLSAFRKFIQRERKKRGF